MAEKNADENFQETRQEREGELPLSLSLLAELARITTFVARRNFTSTANKIKMTGPLCAATTNESDTGTTYELDATHDGGNIRRVFDGRRRENCREETPEQRLQKKKRKGKKGGGEKKEQSW